MGGLRNLTSHAGKWTYRLSPYIIKVGQTIRVPYAVYVVQPGERWYAVARNTGVSLKDLLTANNSTIDTPLYPYQILSLPV